MKNEVALTPRHIASVSGGKDSLFMLKYIIEHPSEFPLDEVVYFDLETDYPFIKDVIEVIKDECVKLCIPFTAIKPKTSWYELYTKYGYPTRLKRWCNSKYKLSCRKQFEDMQKELGFKAIWYIGYCADETSRFENRKIINEIYPLVEIGMNEDIILQWAKQQTIYNDYYKVCNRCGCMGCPLASRIEYAYLLKYYPKEYQKYLDYMHLTEILETEKRGTAYKILYHYDTYYLDNNIKTKWLPKLEEKLKELE